MQSMGSQNNKSALHSQKTNLEQTDGDRIQD